jgi:3-hydroxybutyryl-CoA dehydrogenase
MIKIENITIVGGGTLGSQIAWQTAFMGFNVVAYDAFDKGLEASKSAHKKYAELFSKSKGATKEEIEQTLSRIRYSTNLEEAVKDADLVSESIPEDIEIKKGFYKELAKVAPKKTIFTTNSSSTLPSDYAALTGRPEKFLALHFANGIWDTNTGEVMGHAGTDPEIFDRVVKFASEIGMTPIPIHKEQNGYILNSLLIPLLSAAQDLFFNEVSDYESIDKTWMISMGTKMGPFGILDMVGLQTSYNISILWGKRLGDQNRLKHAAILKSDFIDKGKLGVSSGEGFYKYPNPKYADSDFLK